MISHSRTVENGTAKLFPTKPDGSRNIDWDWDQAKTWAQMEALLSTGKVKAIGVSNCSPQIIDHLAKTGKVVPAVNQVELHPYCPQHDLKKYCENKGILLQAYSPLGSTGSPLSQDEEVVRIAKKHDVEPATVLISYQVNRGVIVLPKSVTPSRESSRSTVASSSADPNGAGIESNLKVIKLDSEDVKALDGLAAAGKQQRVNTPAWGTDFGFADWYGPGNKNAPEGAKLVSTQA